RRMLWDIVTGIHREFGVTVLLTSHYIEEADALCDRIAIIDQGKIIAEGTPSELKARVNADIVELTLSDGTDPKVLSTLAGVQEVRAQGNGWILRVESSETFLQHLLSSVPADHIRRISIEKPSLETVFLQLTGRRFGQDEPAKDVKKFYAQIRRLRV
ncbi:MAG TPA: DUF4162 domain-containing protein, partial [Thermoplasmata archaeon]|nr:DUF4162 domain-containing protein [Thermoplasmata archaeon]